VCCPKQHHDLGQIVGPKTRSTSGYDDERIATNDVGPLRRDGLEVATLILEIDTVLAPRLAAREKNEPLAMQRMERVGDLNPSLIVAIMCS
jgi:hypothetical protein